MTAPSDVNEIYLSSSPHFSAKRTTSGIMLRVIAALLPLCVFGVVMFGLPALTTILVSVTSCVVFEWAFQRLTRQTVRVRDLSAIVTGLMLALVLPPSVPVWMTMLGALFAVVVAKGFFGGIGANVFNPALTGRAFLFVSFPVAMSTWTLPFDGVTGATVLGEMKGGVFFADADMYLRYFLGTRAGCIGETSVLLILAAFVFLLASGVIDWRAPVAMVAVSALCAWLSGGDPLMSVLSGGLMFGAVFMATDYATTPVTKYGRLAFGAGCGLITFLIRRFGGYPEGVMFSILIMNVLTPFLNRLVPAKYGRKSSRGGLPR